MTKEKKQPAKKAAKPAAKKAVKTAKAETKKAAAKAPVKKVVVKDKFTHTTETLDTIAAHIKAGKLSFSEIAEKTGKSISYVYWARRVHNIPLAEKAKEAAKQPKKSEKPATAVKAPAKKEVAAKKEKAPKAEKPAAAEKAVEKPTAMELAKQNAAAKLPEEKKRLDTMKLQYSLDQNGAPLNPMQIKALEAQTKKIANLEVLAK